MKQALQMALSTVAKAKEKSQEELNGIKDKLSCMEEKAQTSIEKALNCGINALLKNTPAETATSEVKDEIIQKLSPVPSAKNIVPMLKYANSVLLKNVPKNLNDIKNLKSQIANTLVTDAKGRLESK